MRLRLLAGLSTALFCASAVLAGGFVSTGSVTLPASGEAAGRHNPPCTDGYTPTTAQIVTPQVYAILDNYTGFPIASTMSSVIPGFDSWVAARMGIHNGPSTCASQCIVVPAGTAVRACMSDGHDGTQCKALANGDGPLAWAGTESLTKEETKGKHIICTTGKNWSHDRNRNFWLDTRTS